ncbi:PUA-like domain-containing protein [Microdochium trichocladiopsis]|uniref:PUA-like domain-containing protein n=1 Tax=Microdochium trichocladiopsis TaxID=1682393 RepID=A0A9P9BX54_9PEZI|nr:PUA-like domain-containing protein [Microdochium trichocladiopsis]KAH7041235.1 PUA-like domain-containing protein [Microdochium trichocladiopsis]
MSSIDPQRPDVVAFMAEASATLNRHLPSPKDVFSFGDDDARLNDSLLALVLDGKKTGTATFPIPEPLHWGPGDYAVVVDSKGRPRAVIRTVSFARCPFKDVTEDFALSEAEGDYDTWRKSHIWFWKDNQGEADFSEESIVLCERFELVYPKASAA